MNITIKQPTDRVENVTSALIDKLYKAAIGGGQIVLEGNLKSTAAHENAYNYLNNKTTFPNLYLAVDNLYLSFDDTVWETFAANTWGDGIGVTKPQMRASSCVNTNNVDCNVMDLRYCDWAGTTDSVRFYPVSANNIQNSTLYVGKVHQVSISQSDDREQYGEIIGYSTNKLNVYGWNYNRLVVDTIAFRYITDLSVEQWGNSDWPSVFRGSKLTVNKLYIGNTTPPPVCSQISAVVQIFVPVDSVAAYQSANVWSNVSARIQGYDFENDPDGIFTEIDKAWNLDGTAKN